MTAVRAALRRARRWYEEAALASPHSVAIERVLAPLVRALPPSAVVLDLGAPRDHPRALDVAGRYIALDIDPRRRPHVVADAARLPFRDAALDAVTATSVMLMLEDPEAVFAEIHRVLRPGGRAIVFAELICYVCLAGGEDADLQRYTPARLRRLAARFEPLALVPVGSHHTFYANVLWRRVTRALPRPVRDPIALVLAKWARLGGDSGETPIGHVVVATRAAS